MGASAILAVRPCPDLELKLFGASVWLGSCSWRDLLAGWPRCRAGPRAKGDAIGAVAVVLTNRTIRTSDWQ